jgi:glucose/arabinose dehydrogenase
MLSHCPLRGAAVAAFAACLAAQNPPAGFAYQTLTVGLQSATAMAFLPDGRLLVTERTTGDVRVFADGALRAAPWATIATNSSGSWAERGLLGIAVDPAFLTNRFVYVFYTDPSGAENRIARLTDSGGVGTNPTILNPAGSIPAILYHNGGAMVFGQDGTLFVATGDAMSSNDAQNPASWLGKVLRFDVPNLTVPANNPFAGSAIYSLGHRNHFGLAIHPVTGVLYQTENGGALMDEVNRIVPGGNYGWPLVEGTEAVPDPTLVDPLAFYQPTTAPTGTCFYSGDHYPLAYRNAWFFADWNMNRLRMLTLDASGTTVVAQSVFDQPPGSGYGITTGPDGNLWLLTNDSGGFGANEIGRYVHVNEPSPSLQLSSVSNKTLGASLTVCIHGANGAIAVPWVSLSRYPSPLPTPFGNLWVPGDATLDVLLLLGDDRAYLGLPVPNAPAFLGTSIHAQGVVLTPAGALVMTNASELVIRG